MNLNSVKVGLKVTTANFESTNGFGVEREYLTNRRAGATGTIQGIVRGLGGDVWWVRHDEGDIAAYYFTELNPA
jgi:hypothetical protein